MMNETSADKHKFNVSSDISLLRIGSVSRKDLSSNSKTKSIWLLQADCFLFKRIKGRGYCDVGTRVISEFYTPLVPKGHDFLQTIGRLAQERQVMPEQQGKEN